MRYDDEDQPRPKRRPDPADNRTNVPRGTKRKVRTVRPRTWKDETDVALEREAPRVEPDPVVTDDE